MEAFHGLRVHLVGRIFVADAMKCQEGLVAVGCQCQTEVFHFAQGKIGPGEVNNKIPHAPIVSEPGALTRIPAPDLTKVPEPNFLEQDAFPGNIL